MLQSSSIGRTEDGRDWNGGTAGDIVRMDNISRL